ncbi:MAG: ABC transporter permease [Acidobacteria bacterium]|nr:ABC transporter permease [Acidobacteriota bacterium]MCI0620375.1 ABC transporter permease [Acidobacteriota bacterium]MCI0724128.1 ABC transporter permease [Acidobacteriota bacterium]
MNVGRVFTRNYATLGLLAGLLTLISILEGRFIQPSNLLNVLLQISIEGMIACGLTLVILSGGLDLSVGAVTALSGVLFVTSLPLGLELAGILALLGGALVGVANGFLIGRIKLNSLIVTLGTMAAVQGAALWISGGYPLPGPGGDFEMLGGGFFLYVPLPIVFFGLVALAGHFGLSHTQFGRDLYAIGGNRDAARLADIPIAIRECWAYVLCSLLSAFSGIVLASRLNTGSPIVGQDAPLQAIAAIVLGGTSLYGGRGGIVQTVIGMAIIGVLSNGLNLLNVSPAYQWGIKGSALIVVAGLDSARTASRFGRLQSTRP